MEAHDHPYLRAGASVLGSSSAHTTRRRAAQVYLQETRESLAHALVEGADTRRARAAVSEAQEALAKLDREQMSAKESADHHQTQADREAGRVLATAADEELSKTIAGLGLVELENPNAHS